MAAYKTKRFPPPFDAPWLHGLTQSCAFILAANWCLQGMRGMDRKELAFRLLLEAVVAAAFLPVLPAPLALVLAHTFSFTLNGQVWVCARYCASFRGNPARFAAFLDTVRAELGRLAWLDEAALIGSRGSAHKAFGLRSDIDLRLIFPPGVMGWLRTNLLLLSLRSRAFIRRVPLDLYAYDGPASLARLNQAEPLRLLLDRRGRLAAAYPQRVTA